MQARRQADARSRPPGAVVDLIGLVLIVILSMIAPGLMFVRKLSWNPLETLCAAVGLSGFLLYVIAFVGSEMGLLNLTSALVTLSAVGAAISCRRQLRRLFSHRATRTTLWAFALVLIWALLLQLTIRHYGGANWSGDWFEHYQRSVFFTTYPKDLGTVFIDRYLLPARPPVMNLVVASFMAQTGLSFAAFQVVHTILGSLVFLPLCLVMRRFRPSGRQSIWVLAALLSLSPVFCQNVTYTWTRLFCAFYVLLGVALYQSALSHGDRRRMGAAFAALAVSLLVHYSAGPYVVVLAAHYLVFEWRNRRAPIKELATIVIVGALILTTWFGWSVHQFGLQDTIASNTTFTDARGQSIGDRLGKTAVDIWRTVVPHPFWTSLPDDTNRFHPLADARDTSFLLYQTNAVFGLGSLGWLALALIGWKACRANNRRDTQARRFWLVFTVGVFGLGISVNSTVTGFGSAHVCLQPLLFIALALIASRFAELSRPLTALIIIGCFIDLVVGIVLHVFLLHTDIAPGLGTVTTFNWQIKQRAELFMLGDAFAQFSAITLPAVAAGGLAWLASLVVHRRKPSGKTA